MLKAAVLFSVLTIACAIAGTRYPVMQRVAGGCLLLLAECLIGDRLT